jgi:hypothetical protein
MKLDYPFGVHTKDVVPAQWKAFGVGIDVHKEMLWACVLTPDFLKGTQERQLSKFATNPAGLRMTH